MALINPINNFATPVSYSTPITTVAPVTRKPANSGVDLEVEKTNSRDLKIDDRTNKRTAEATTSTEETGFVEVSPEEQKNFEAAQQRAQRAEFISQTNERASASNENPRIYAEGLIEPESLQKENPAITLFNELQNIEATPRLGQEVNKFV